MARVARLTPGDPAPGFDLPGVDRRNHALTDYHEQPLAVVFSCCHCPYVVASDYAGRAGLVAINSNAGYLGDSFEDMERRSREKGFVFPFLYDESQETARAYGAARTPEVFVFDASHQLVYHGAPDADHGDPSEDARYLREALDATFTGGTPAVAETPPVGCTIKWR
jgi:peroxiredoxin